MNTIGTAVLHVARTAGVDPQPASGTSLGFALATWLARIISRLGHDRG